MRTRPLAPGESLPDLTLSHSDGTPASLETFSSGRPLVVYFMRTPTCPVCNAHLRRMQRTTVGGDPLAQRLLIVVPGDAAEATLVAQRHPELADRIASSPDAHASVGLFVRGGLQQSGTFVIDATRTVIAARTATIPLGAYDETEMLGALQSAEHASRRAD